MKNSSSSTVNALLKLAAITGVILMSICPAARVSAATSTAYSIPELQSYINSAAAGDVIVLADGTYLNSALTIGRSNVTVRSATPGGVYLNGTNSITISGNYVTFSGFQFTSGSISGIVIDVRGSHNLLTQLNFMGYSAQKYIVIQDGTQYNEIAFSNFENKPQSAPSGNLIHIAAHSSIPGYHKIRYSSFRNMPGPGGDFGNEPIRLSNGAQSTYISRTVVEFNYFTNTGGGDSEAISVKCRQNTIRHNTFANNPDAMLVFRNGDDNIAYSNFFVDAGGIRVKEANNIYVYNNYFERAGVGGTMNAIAYDYVSPNLKNLNFVHNTFISSGMIDLSSGASANTWANNVFDKDAGTIFSGSTAGISWAGNLYRGTLGVSIPAGMTYSADLGLVQNSDGYIGLSSSSPAIDASSDSYPAILDIPYVDDDPALLLDASGQARPEARTLKDVGSDEFATGATVTRPLKLSDVGPSYLGGPGGGGTPSMQTLTVSKSGTGSGTVTSAPAGIDCGLTCTASFGTGTSIALTATASPGSTFTGWSGGGCAGTGTCAVNNISTATSVAASFALSKYTLTVTLNNTAYGKVTSSPSGISCGPTCSYQYDSGINVTLTATPVPGHRFSGWSGACSGRSSTCTLAMTANRSAKANFK